MKQIDTDYTRPVYRLCQLHDPLGGYLTVRKPRGFSARDPARAISSTSTSRERLPDFLWNEI